MTPLSSISEVDPRAGPGPPRETLGLNRKHLQWIWQRWDLHISLGKELQVGMLWYAPEVQAFVGCSWKADQGQDTLVQSPLWSWHGQVQTTSDWEAFQFTFVLKFMSLHYLAKFILSLFARAHFCHGNLCRVVSVHEESRWCAREWPTLELRNYTGISLALRKAYGLSYDTWGVIHSFQEGCLE